MIGDGNAFPNWELFTEKPETMCSPRPLPNLAPVRTSHFRHGSHPEPSALSLGLGFIDSGFRVWLLGVWGFRVYSLGIRIIGPCIKAVMLVANLYPAGVILLRILLQIPKKS